MRNKSGQFRKKYNYDVVGKIGGVLKVSVDLLTDTTENKIINE